MCQLLSSHCLLTLELVTQMLPVVPLSAAALQGCTGCAVAVRLSFR